MLIPYEFEAMVIFTGGGIVPDGKPAEALGVKDILAASVKFPPVDADHKLLVWPEFLQWPHEDVLAGIRILVMDDVWISGRTITSVKDRILESSGLPEICVLHCNLTHSLFDQTRPDYHGAVTDAYIVCPLGNPPRRRFRAARARCGHLNTTTRDILMLACSEGLTKSTHWSDDD